MTAGMQAAFITIVTILSAGTIALTILTIISLRRKKFLTMLFPDCPFAFRWFPGREEHPVFLLPQYQLHFELKRGTRKDGFFGVIGITFTGYTKFKYGTNMYILARDVDKLILYLTGLGYEVKDNLGIIKELKDAVANISPLEYLDNPQSQSS